MTQNLANFLDNLMEKQNKLEKLQQELNEVKGDIDNQIVNISRLQEEEKQLLRQQKLQEGIVIDYKTFSEIINILTFCEEQGIINNDFVLKLIDIGKKQTDYKKNEQAETPKEEVNSETIEERIMKKLKEVKQIEEKQSCNLDCKNCKDQNGEIIHQLIKSDPILTLLQMVRDSANQKPKR